MAGTGRIAYALFNNFGLQGEGRGVPQDFIGYVYFIEAKARRGIGLIKIGWTNSPPKKRLAHLQVGSPVKLLPIAYRRGDQEFEGYLHRRFREHWSHGEWHRPHHEVLKFIEGHARDWSDPNQRILSPGTYFLPGPGPLHARSEPPGRRDRQCDACRQPIPRGTGWFLYRAKWGEQGEVCLACSLVPSLSKKSPDPTPRPWVQIEDQSIPSRRLTPVPPGPSEESRLREQADADRWLKSQVSHLHGVLERMQGNKPKTE